MRHYVSLALALAILESGLDGLEVRLGEVRRGQVLEDKTSLPKLVKREVLVLDVQPVQRVLRDGSNFEDVFALNHDADVERVEVAARLAKDLLVRQVKLGFLEEVRKVKRQIDVHRQVVPLHVYLCEVLVQVKLELVVAVLVVNRAWRDQQRVVEHIEFIRKGQTVLASC